MQDTIMADHTTSSATNIIHKKYDNRASRKSFYTSFMSAGAGNMRARHYPVKKKMFRSQTPVWTNRKALSFPCCGEIIIY